MVGAIIIPEAAGGAISEADQVAGLSLFTRAVLTARLAAPGPLIVLRREDAAEQPRPADVRRLRLDEIRFTTAAELAQVLAGYPADQQWLLMPVDVVTDPRCARALVAALATGEPVAMQSSGSTLYAGDSALALQVAVGKTPDTRSVRQIEVPAETVCMTVRSREDLREAARRLLASASRGSDTDGWVDHVLNRHISRAFTRLVLPTPLTPNGVTYLHCVLGLLACALMTLPEYGWAVLGALLLQLSVALDCSDGEVARLKLQFSRFGGTLDIIGDNVVHAAIFIAIAAAAQRQLGTPLALALGGSAAAGILIAFLVVWWLTGWQRRQLAAGKSAGYALAPVAANHQLLGQAYAAPPPAAAKVDAFINELTSRDFSVLLIGAALAGHLEWMLWMAAVGAHVFWLAFLLVQLYFFRAPHEATV